MAAVTFFFVTWCNLAEKTGKKLGLIKYFRRVGRWAYCHISLAVQTGRVRYEPYNNMGWMWLVIIPC